MHEIVYIPFEKSVNEVRDKSVKELKAAGYEIKVYVFARDHSLYAL